MRIIVLADPLDNQLAGIHHYTRNLVKHLAKVDKEQEYYILRRKKDSLFPHERQVIVKNYKFPGYAAFRMFVLIPLKIRRLKANIVIEPAHFGPFNLPRKIKRITVIHDLTPILFSHLHRFHSQLLQKIFLKSILRRASLIITNSDSTTSDLIKYYPPSSSKTKRIYLGRDESLHFTGKRHTLHDQVGETQYFLYAGTIEPRKNLKTLLRAYTLFRKKTSLPHKLIIAGGKGWKSGSFFRQLEKHPYKDDIILTGYVSREDLASLYSNTEAFIFPSHYEGFGLPVVEAMSCGAACLLSTSSSLPEVGGKAALYFDPVDEDELSGLMIRITEDRDLKKELSKKALEQAEKFSWDTYANEFHANLKKLMTG